MHNIRIFLTWWGTQKAWQRVSGSEECIEGYPKSGSSQGERNLWSLSELPFCSIWGACWGGRRPPTHQDHWHMLASGIRCTKLLRSPTVWWCYLEVIWSFSQNRTAICKWWDMSWGMQGTETQGVDGCRADTKNGDVPPELWRKQKQTPELQFFSFCLPC